MATIADTYGVSIGAMAEPGMRAPAEARHPHATSLPTCACPQRITTDEHLRLRTALERAVERDPHEATRPVDRAIVRIDEDQRGMNPCPDAMETATKLARAAVSVDPTSRPAHQAPAFVASCRRDIGALLDAATLDPSSSCALAHVGLLTAHCDGCERGAELVRRAIDLNPNHPAWDHSVTCNSHVQRGGCHEALAEAQRIDVPAPCHAHVALGTAHGELGSREEAREAVEEPWRLHPVSAEKRRESSDLTVDASWEAGLGDE